MSARLNRTQLSPRQETRDGLRVAADVERRPVLYEDARAAEEVLLIN